MLADTAKLAVELNLTGNLKSGIAGVERSLTGLNRQTNQIGQGFKTMGAGIGVALRNAAVIGVAAVGGLTAGIVQMVKDGQTAAKSQKLFANAIQSSGLVSQQYVKILTDQQQAMLQLTGTDDEVVKDIQTRLITMHATGQQTAALTPLIIAASRASGKSIETVAMAVGKGIQGNAAALGRLGIVLPKATAATKSAALASLEQQKLALAAAEAQDKAHGALSKSEKATWDHRKAVLAAAIAQQKLTDSTKKGAAAGSSYDAVFGELNKRFGKVNDALSGQLETRLGALRESLQNVREEAGMKLAPAITTLVGVVSAKLVPAFGSFIDRILPGIITGIEKFTSLLENGGAEQGIRGITEALGPMIAMLKIAAAPVKLIVDAFLSLPSQVQGILIGSFAINKLSGGLIGQGVGQIAKGALGGALGGLAQRGATAANPVFVSDVAGGLGGDLLPTAAKAGLVTAAAGIAAAAIGSYVLITTIQDLAAQEVASGAREGKPIVNMSGGARLGGAFPLGTFHGPTAIPADQRNPDRFDRAMFDAVRTGAEAGVKSGIVHSGVFGKAQAIREAGGFRLSRDALIAATHGKGPLGTDALITAQAIALASGNKLRSDPSERNLASAANNLALLKRAQDHMPADLATKLEPKIHSLEVAINRVTAEIKAKQFTVNAYIPPGTPGSVQKPGAHHAPGTGPLLDDGAWSLPRDMPARLHRGEMVVPRRFAEGLRSSGPTLVTVNANVSISTREVNTAQAVRLRHGPTPTQVGAA